MNHKTDVKVMREAIIKFLKTKPEGEITSRLDIKKHLKLDSWGCYTNFDKALRSTRIGFRHVHHELGKINGQTYMLATPLRYYFAV